MHPFGQWCAVAKATAASAFGGCLKRKTCLFMLGVVAAGSWNCGGETSGSDSDSASVGGASGGIGDVTGGVVASGGRVAGGAAGNPSPETKADACYEKELGLDAGSCEWQKTCAQSVEIDGATVTRNANTQVSCTWGDDTASCTCTGSNNAGRAYR